MPPNQQWEYAVIYTDSDQRDSWIDYSAPHDVDTDEFPRGAVGAMFGELGGKGWELVAVTDSVGPDGIRRERQYFKRPHDPNRALKA